MATPNIKSAIETLSKTPLPGPGNQPSIGRAKSHNLATLSQVIPWAEIRYKMQKAGAVSAAEKNEFLECELRARGYPVFGEALKPKIEAVAPKSEPVEVPVTPAAAPVAVAPIVAAVLATQPLSATAAEYISKPAAEQAAFGLHGGKMLRSEFEKMTPAAQTAYFKTGAKLMDAPAEAKARTAGTSEFHANADRPGVTIDRATFDALTPAERMEHFHNGGKLVD